MRFQIDLKIHYDSESGKAEVKSVKVASGPQPFAQAIESSGEEMTRESLPQSPPGNVLAEARHLAGLLGIDESHVTDALSRRPQGRVLEVLRWMKKRRTVEAIRNPVGLFHSLVTKD